MITNYERCISCGKSISKGMSCDCMKVTFQPERSKREDSIEKVIPPKLTKGMAISAGKRIANLKKIAGVSPELLGCGTLNIAETQ